MRSSPWRPAVTQNIILFLLGVPAQIAVTQPHTRLDVTDYALGALGFLTLLIEFIADNQQYSYQTFKRSGKLNPNEWIGARITWTKRDAERGFVTRGLWAWSRHPNFLCEQSFWVCCVVVNVADLLTRVRVLDHYQLDPTSVCGWTVEASMADVAEITSTTCSKLGAVYAVLLVDLVHGVDLTVQVPRRIQGLPATCWDVCPHLHFGVGCGAERAGKESGGR